MTSSAHEVLSTIMAGIDSTGNVRGCEALYDSRFIEGNLRDLPLDEIWGNPNAFAYNRAFTLEKLTGICSTCEVRGRCAGGCRSMLPLVLGL